MLTTEARSDVSRDGPRTAWRMIVDWGLPGALNMAVDEVLLDSVIAGGPPTIRFYTWEPAALSLGANQALGEVDRAACERRGFDVVRRTTGGRAVLHQHELTYSVAVRENDPLVSGGVVESYRKISAALVTGLRLLGAEVALAPPDRAMHRALALSMRAQPGASEDKPSGSHGAICFDAASDYELTARGRKLVGSAQARRGGALLQHGSILLDIDWDAWAAVFAYRSEAGRQRAAQKLPLRMTSLSEELGRPVTAHEVSQTVRRGFAETFEIDLGPGRLTSSEIEAAQRIATEKYGSDAWTTRK
ncbi:MAG: biotin/lipoate A/B protein ligase family protein [Chloroflexia bacterium]